MTAGSPPANYVSRSLLWRLAVGFVVLTLMALVLIPVIVQRRVMSLRSDIVASEPARTLVTRWQFTMVREMAALTAIARDGDMSRFGAYRAAHEEEQAVLDRLAPQTRRLGDNVESAFAVARAACAAWHERTVGDASRPLSQDEAFVTEIQPQPARFEHALASIATVDSVIIRTTAATRDRIGLAEQIGLFVTSFLGVLALLAAGAVIGLGARLRRFAEEAERRRNEAGEALAASARANEARSRLLRGITHDVKNPLGAAKGYAELLGMEVKAPLSPEQAPLVQGIVRSVDGALHIVGDLLDLARLDSGGLKVERVETDVNVLVAEAASDHKGPADAVGHTVEVRTPARAVLADTDPSRVRQILANLLSNAIKYTPPPGRIVVESEDASGERDASDGGFVVIRVSDTGPGIPPDQREAIFDEFSRLHEDSPTKGHGLGLAIARGLARQLGGDLHVADADGGATFVLKLPRSAGPHRDVHAAASATG